MIIVTIPVLALRSLSDFWILNIWDGGCGTCSTLLYSILHGTGRSLFDKQQSLGVEALTLSGSCVLFIDIMKYSKLIYISGYVILGHIRAESLHLQSFSLKTSQFKARNECIGIVQNDCSISSIRAKIHRISATSCLSLWFSRDKMASSMF